MKILLLIFLIILPISNELIKQNMGFLQAEVSEYYYIQESIAPSGPAKSPFRDDYYTLIAKDGTVFTVVYRTILGDYGVIVTDDGGLGLYGWYGSVSSMQLAAQEALLEYNNKMPIGSPIYLLPFGLLYLLKKRKEQTYNK